MSSFLTVALGGAIGASARHGLSLMTLRFFGPGFPIGTLLANVIGGFLMGILMGWLVREMPENANSIRLFAGVGVLGGFTTFSAFSLDALRMLETKRYFELTGYIGGSVVLSIAAVAIGLICMRTAI